MFRDKGALEREEPAAVRDATFEESTEAARVTERTRHGFLNKERAKRDGVRGFLDEARKVDPELTDPYDLEAKIEDMPHHPAGPGFARLLEVPNREKKLDAEIKAKHAADPGNPLWTNPKTGKPLTVNDLRLRQATTNQEYAEGVQARESFGVTSIAAGMYGWGKEAITNPVDVAMATVGMGMGLKFKSLGVFLWSAAKQAGFFGTGRAVSLYHGSEQAEEIGKPITMTEAGTEVVGDAVGGVIIEGTLGTVGRVLGRKMGWIADEPDVPEVPLSPVEQKIADATTETELADAIGEAAKDRPELTPIVEGLKKRAEIRKQTETDLDPSEAKAGEAQLNRAMTDPDEPMPGTPLGKARKATDPNLSDAAELPEILTIQNKPAKVEQVLPTSLARDTDMQFRTKGKTEDQRLRGVTEWNPDAAGRMVAWERADGTRVVVDGDARTRKAKQIVDNGGEVGTVETIILREKDGWTKAEARDVGAKKNAQQKMDDPIAFARMIKRNGDFVDDSLPLGSRGAEIARLLARLSDIALSMVEAGKVSPAKAALVARLVPDAEKHLPILQAMQTQKFSHPSQVRKFIKEKMDDQAREAIPTPAPAARALPDDPRAAAKEVRESNPDVFEKPPRKEKPEGEAKGDKADKPEDPAQKKIDKEVQRSLHEDVAAAKAKGLDPQDFEAAANKYKAMNVVEACGK
jgi:hypothetical protein